MNDTSLLIGIILAFCVLFPLLWFGVTRLLKKVAGTDQAVDVSVLGDKVADLGSGSARINGINHNHCLSMTQYQHGVILSVSGLFGGGQKVLLFKDIMSIKAKRYFILGQQVIIRLAGGEKISLYGRLAAQWKTNVDMPSE